MSTTLRVTKQASGDILPDTLEKVGAGSWFPLVDPPLLRMQYGFAGGCRKVSITIQLSK